MKNKYGKGKKINNHQVMENEQELPYEDFERYLGQEMPVEELEAFEIRLQNEPELAAELKLFQMLKEAIQLKGNRSFIQELSAQSERPADNEQLRFELIDDYIADRMGPVERHDFEQLLAQNTDLARDVETQGLAIDAVSLAENKFFFANLGKEIAQEPETEANDFTDTETPAKGRQVVYPFWQHTAFRAAAAVAALVIIAFLAIFGQLEKEPQLLASTTLNLRSFNASNLGYIGIPRGGAKTPAAHPLGQNTWQLMFYKDEAYPRHSRIDADKGEIAIYLTPPSGGSLADKAELIYDTGGERYLLRLEDTFYSLPTAPSDKPQPLEQITLD